MAHTASAAAFVCVRLAKARWRHVESTPNGAVNFFWLSSLSLSSIGRGAINAHRLWNLLKEHLAGVGIFFQPLAVAFVIASKKIRRRHDTCKMGRFCKKFLRLFFYWRPLLLKAFRLIPLSIFIVRDSCNLKCRMFPVDFFVHLCLGRLTWYQVLCLWKFLTISTG
jgi:hypothetical protein